MGVGSHLDLSKLNESNEERIWHKESLRCGGKLYNWTSNSRLARECSNVENLVIKRRRLTGFSAIARWVATQSIGNYGDIGNYYYVRQHWGHRELPYYICKGTFAFYDFIGELSH